MTMMLLQKELDQLFEFIREEAKTLGLSSNTLHAIEAETVTNVRFSFPSSTSQIELIRRVVQKIASYVPFTEEALEDIGLAMDEACTNVITHSYDGQQGSIKVEFTLEPKQLTILLIDEGEKGQSFHPEVLPSVEKEKYLQQLSRGGLGVYLIKKIMDEVEYTVTPGSSNCLKLVKYVHPSA